jgi:hypothetical protein
LAERIPVIDIRRGAQQALLHGNRLMLGEHAERRVEPPGKLQVHWFEGGQGRIDRRAALGAHAQEVLGMKPVDVSRPTVECDQFTAQVDM